ncbi:hypothetical protein ACFYY8_24545 [Streptosporangium sp. NPDC001559]|uniref:hypothetical protein n=1 Tax=Streptosporangium sp. NPDC001559 TaxID=3366187 RepID=UPI0036EE24D0
MKEGHEFRWGGLAGIAALVFMIAGRLTMGNVPRVTDPAAVIVGYFPQYRVQILIGALLYAIAIALLLWFGAALATAFRCADETGDAPALVLAGYVLMCVLGFIGVALFAGIAYALTMYRGLLEVAAGPYTALTAMGTVAGIAVAVPFGASAAAILRTRVFPVWMAWFAVVVAAANVLSAFAVGVTGGALAPDGPIVGYVPGVLVGLWVLVASGLLIREHLPLPAGARPVMGH